MHLKRLEAYGFKSFADKITLDFTTGVTCIVGPNGCGKSNVCDAIKWVLGEQNAKNIRSGGHGKTMQEVIFKGTDNRSRMNFCEVSLIFDNTDRAYRVDFDELIITRKLYRTGESEYSINRQKARLKDIIDMFRDTGIGKDGYSVVGQGQIDAILSARPEDRRQIFEEAAGISKFKADRKEAMTRLERSLLNIRSLDEQLKLLENIITPLRKEAEVAIKAKALNGRIKTLDINHFLYVTDHSEEQRTKLREKLNRENTDLIATSLEKERTDKAFNDAQEELKTLDENYKVLSEKRVKLSVEEAARKKDDEHFGERLTQTSADIERYTNEIDEKQKQLEVNRKMLVDYSASNEQKSGEFLQAKTDEQGAIENYNTISDAVSQKQMEISLTNQALLNAADKTGAINADIAMLTAQKTALEENINRRNSEIAEHKEEMKKAEKAIATLDEGIAAKNAEIDKKRGEQRSLQEKYNDVMNKYNDAEDRFRERIGTIANLKGKINLLESSRNSYSNYDRAVKFLMTHQSPSVKNRICGVLGDLLKVSSPKFATAVDIALGNNINNIVTETAENAAFLINVIKDAGAGRATFYPLDNMHPRPLEPIYESALDEDGVYGLAADLVRFDNKYRDVVETLLGKVVVVEDLDTAIRIGRKYRHGFRIVTLDGDNQGTTGSLTGGSKGAGETHILSLENDILEANKQLKTFEKEYGILNAEMETLKGQKKELETADSVVGNIIVKLKGEISALEQQKMILNQNKVRFEFDIDKLRTENNLDMQHVAEKEAQISFQSKETSDQSKARTGSTDALTLLGNQLADLKKQLSEADTRRTELLTKTKTLEGDLSELRTAMNVAQKTIDRLGQEILERESLLATKKAEKERLIADIQRIAEMSSDSEELRKVSEELSNLDVKKAELTDKQDKSFKESSALAERISSIGERKARIETNLENIDIEIANLSENIKESYQLDYETALPYREADYNDSNGIAENKTLKRSLAALGPVNENAENSLALHESEYNETKIHYDDVVKAKEMLEETISDLTNKMESIFTESFEQIKVNFAEVFNLLFDGGKGKLELDLKPGESVLDAGINIEAEPPGKKLANITLLSGGERALTAIAIIFAIIKLHPMPFCVLDEVDAPLDDSNARIYARFLQKYSKRTQFIIISHRKPTMELADELYGITMQEQGVSKQLSIKLADALKLANKGDNE